MTEHWGDRVDEASDELAKLNQIQDEHIERLVVREGYGVVEGVMVCVLVLSNGWKQAGISVPVDQRNWHSSLAKKLARRDAVREAVKHEGYRLKSDLQRYPEVKVKRGE